MKKDLGLFGPDHPEGMPCDRMYDLYARAYREITAIGALQQHCLRYEAWKVQARYKKGEISWDWGQKQMAILEKASQNLSAKPGDILRYYRRGSSNKLLDCNDGSKWAGLWHIMYPDKVRGSHPAATFPLHLIFPEKNEVRPDYQDLDTRFKRRDISLSGLALECTAIASVPLPKNHKGNIKNRKADAFFDYV